MKREGMRIEFKQCMDDPAVLELYLYSAVLPEEEGGVSQNTFREQLSRYPQAEQIRLYINSPGGLVAEGYGIYAQLKRHPAYKTAYIDGFANSIASVIAMSCDHIVMRENAMMGMHNIEGALFGSAREHRKYADELDRMMEGNRKIYLARSGGKISAEDLAALLDAQTMLTARECLQYGLCDEIDGMAKSRGAADMTREDGVEPQGRESYFPRMKQAFSQGAQAAGQAEAKAAAESKDPEEKARREPDARGDLQERAGLGPQAWEEPEAEGRRKPETCVGAKAQTGPGTRAEPEPAPDAQQKREAGDETGRHMEAAIQMLSAFLKSI